MLARRNIVDAASQLQNLTCSSTSKVSPEPRQFYRLDADSLLADGIDTARTTMLTNTKATFEDILAAFTSQLTDSRAADETFFENADRQARILTAPLAEEIVEAIFSRDGKRVSETFTIGDRVDTFRKLVEKEETQLSEYWKQWDEVQNEYLQLGVEVFGGNGFGEDGKGVAKARDEESGFKREMELLELEYETRFQELEEEIENIKAEFLQAMKASEKVSCLLFREFCDWTDLLLQELDILAKKEQARLLQAIIQE